MNINAWKRTSTTMAVAASAAAVLVGCGSGDDEAAGHDASTADIFAAASLRVAGDDLAEGFKADGNDGELRFNYAGSSDLARQIGDGAPADVFISANEATMDRAVAENGWNGQDAETVATNRLVLALPDGNPAGIQKLADLDATDGHGSAPRVSLCARQVPCGTIAHEVLNDQGITLDRPSEEANVGEVSTKVSTGSVDAGFIYSTDAQSLKTKGVSTIDIPDVEPNAYPAMLTPAGKKNSIAEEFMQWLSGEHAQKILADHGFDAP